MRTRSTIITMMFAIAVTTSIAGCGDGTNDNIVIGGPTSTPGSGRTPTPVPTITPGRGATATATSSEGTPIEPTATVEGPTPTVEGPTATPTPVAGGCVDGDQLVATASLSGEYGAANITLQYPASANIPGTGTAATVSERVHFAATGITSVNDSDKSGDSVDDTLTASLVSLNPNPPGVFVTVTFDCVAGQAPPTAASFECTVVSASTPDGVAITDEQCTVGVTGP
jgi:hypothetical protein